MQNFIWALVIVLVVGGGFLYWQGMQTNPSPAPSPTTVTPTPGTPTSAPAPTPSGAPMTATVTYDGNSFSPSTVTIKKGGTVTWINAASGQMWVASAVHPSHTVYSGTSRTEHCPDVSDTAFDQCAGQIGNYSFTFTKSGTWGYHDHMMPSATGKVVVVE